MQYSQTSFLLIVALSLQLQAPGVNVKPVGFAGHVIGEPIKIFLRLEPDARSEVEVCEQHPTQSACARLFGALDRGQRAEISTAVQPDLDSPDASSDAYNFVLDGGKLVKITAAVNNMSEVMKSFGQPTAEKSVPCHNSAGDKWENRSLEWDTPVAHITIYIDNNPQLQDHRPLLVIESHEEHTRADANSLKAENVPN